MHFTSLLARCGVTELPLRPLLYAAGAAVTAAGVYYYIKTTKMHRDHYERAAEHAHTSLTQDAGQVPDSSVPAEVKVMVKNRVMMLEELLCETYRKCETKTKEHESAREAYSVLKSECDENKVTLADVKWKYEQEMKRTAQLEQERSEHEDRLRAVVEKVEKHVDLVVRKNESLEQECEREREARSALQSEHDRMTERISDSEASLMVSLAEAVEAHHQATESNAVLEREKTDLMHHVHKLRCTVRDLERMFCEADITCGVIKQERESAREAYSILRSKYEEVTRQRDELAVSLAEAAKRNETVLESSGHLTSEGNTLETRETCGGMMMKTEEDREALSIRNMHINSSAVCS